MDTQVDTGRPRRPRYGQVVVIRGVPSPSVPYVPTLQAFLPRARYQYANAGIGTLTSEKLVQLYLARIKAYDEQGPALNAVITLNPKALETARALDAERKAKGRRSRPYGCSAWTMSRQSCCTAGPCRWASFSRSVGGELLAAGGDAAAPAVGFSRS